VCDRNLSALFWRPTHRLSSPHAAVFRRAANSTASRDDIVDIARSLERPAGEVRQHPYGPPQTEQRFEGCFNCGATVKRFYPDLAGSLFSRTNFGHAYFQPSHCTRSRACACITGEEFSIFDLLLIR
jgi:hypothetical protein